jgi:hypothetical protein
MALSKKHYEQFAHRFQTALNANLVEHHEGSVNEAEYKAVNSALLGLAQGMSLDFALDNPRFNRTRFIDACGF